MVEVLYLDGPNLSLSCALGKKWFGRMMEAILMTATTTTEEFSFIDLDTNASMVEAAVKQFRRVVLRSPVVLRIVGFRAWRSMSHLGKLADEIRSDLGKIEITDQDDRADLLEIAHRLRAMSEMLSESHNMLEQSGLAHKIPIFGMRILTQIDDLSCALEDMAETAALTASETFANTVQKELESVVV